MVIHNTIIISIHYLYAWDSPFPLICIATSGMWRRFDSTCMNDCSADCTQHNTVKLTRRCVPRSGRYSAEVTWKEALSVEPTATGPGGQREVKYSGNTVVGGGGFLKLSANVQNLTELFLTLTWKPWPYIWVKCDNIALDMGTVSVWMYMWFCEGGDMQMRIYDCTT